MRDKCSEEIRTRKKSNLRYSSNLADNLVPVWSATEGIKDISKDNGPQRHQGTMAYCTDATESHHYLLRSRCKTEQFEERNGGRFLFLTSTLFILFRLLLCAGAGMSG